MAIGLEGPAAAGAAGGAAGAGSAPHAQLQHSSSHGHSHRHPHTHHHSSRGLGGAGSAPPRRLRVRATPGSLMLLDALVQRRLAALAARPPTDPIFGLSARLTDAMTVFVEPLPLHFGDASATLANVRPDDSPQRNIASLSMAVA
jgi:hypothetical protein